MIQVDVFVVVIIKMRLLTHNMLKSHVKGIKNGYPFTIEVGYVNKKTRKTWLSRVEFDARVLDHTHTLLEHMIFLGESLGQTKKYVGFRLHAS